MSEREQVKLVRILTGVGKCVGQRQSVGKWICQNKKVSESISHILGKAGIVHELSDTFLFSYR